MTVKTATRRERHARLYPGWDAVRALARGVTRDWRLAYALEAYRHRILTGPKPELWRHALRLGGLRLARGLPLIGWAEAVVEGRWWQPAAPEEGRGGVPVLTLPAIDWAGPLSPEPARLAELLALDPEDPGRWWRLTGALELLGERAAFPWDHGETETPLPLYPSPLAWAWAGGEASGGACILDPDGVLAESLLLGARPLVAEGTGRDARQQAIAFSTTLAGWQRKLRPKLPKVLVRQEARRPAGPTGNEQKAGQ